MQSLYIQNKWLGTKTSCCAPTHVNVAGLEVFWSYFPPVEVAFLPEI